MSCELEDRAIQTTKDFFAAQKDWMYDDPENGVLSRWGKFFRRQAKSLRRKHKGASYLAVYYAAMDATKLAYAKEQLDILLAKTQ